MLTVIKSEIVGGIACAAVRATRHLLVSLR